MKTSLHPILRHPTVEKMLHSYSNPRFWLNDSSAIPCVYVHFTNGAGNNLFQYIYSRLLATNRSLKLAHPAIEFVDLAPEKNVFAKGLSIITIPPNEKDFHKYFKWPEKVNFFVNTYPEDYTLYISKLDEIRKYFKKIPITNHRDLVIHLRLGDRLVDANTYRDPMLVQCKDWEQAINKFKFDRIYIVTDMPVWRPITTTDLKKMRFHVNLTQNKRAPESLSVNYFNRLFDYFDKLNPIVYLGRPLKEDFNTLRSFNQILFQHGTLAWWAAALSGAEKVGVYGPWRPFKGTGNKNLGCTDLPGWFQWGWGSL